MDGRRILTNKRGSTRSLSFRDIARLILVDESSIIAERSPIHSGQFTKSTEENAVFRFLLTGVDDSAIVAQDEPKVRKARREGQSELIDEMLEDARERLGSLELDEDVGLDELDARLSELNDSISDASSALEVEQESASSLEERRRQNWEDLRATDSRLSVLSELQTRFDLLQEQYRSDLARLEAISEAGSQLDQMAEERCPICGARPEDHTIEHDSHLSNLEDVTAACLAESKRIRVLITDLEQTRRANKQEVEELGSRRSELNNILSDTTSRLRGTLQPQINQALEALRNLHEQKANVERSIEAIQQVLKLEELRGEARKPLEKQQRLTSKVGADEAEEFCREVEGLLESWSFPDLGRVTFSEDAQDVVITGQNRSSHGKGVRAITHAAFNLGLLSFCEKVSKPHPGTLVLDSPLIVYRQPDEDERSFRTDVKKAFYRSLALRYTDLQVIIIENEAPPRDLSDLRLIEFTGSSSGRRGFFPG